MNIISFDNYSQKLLVERLVREGGLGFDAYSFLSEIQRNGSWSTNCPSEVAKIDWYRENDILTAIKRVDNQLNPPEFFTLSLTRRGEILVEYLKRTYD